MERRTRIRTTRPDHVTKATPVQEYGSSSLIAMRQDHEDLL